MCSVVKIMSVDRTSLPDGQIRRDHGKHGRDPETEYTVQIAERNQLSAASSAPKNSVAISITLDWISSTDMFASMTRTRFGSLSAIAR